VPACEVLRDSARVQAMLLNPDELVNLHDAIADGSYDAVRSDARVRDAYLGDNG